MERRTPWIVPYLIGYGVGSVMQIVICASNNSGDITPEQVEAVQGYSAQVESDLSSQFDEVRDLRLTVAGQQLEFRSGDEQCQGQYEVKNEIASVAGDIACTQTIPSR